MMIAVVNERRREVDYIYEPVCCEGGDDDDDDDYNNSNLVVRPWLQRRCIRSKTGAHDSAQHFYAAQYKLLYAI